MWVHRGHVGRSVVVCVSTYEGGRGGWSVGMCRWIGSTLDKGGMKALGIPMGLLVYSSVHLSTHAYDCLPMRTLAYSCVPMPAMSARRGRSVSITVPTPTHTLAGALVNPRRPMSALAYPCVSMLAMSARRGRSVSITVPTPTHTLAGARAASVDRTRRQSA